MPSSGPVPSLLLALFAACALVAGSALPNAPLLRRHMFYHRLSLLIGFSAGLMLATALHDLLPEALEANHDYAMWGAGIGFLLLYFAERMTHFHACRHRECEIEPDEDDAPREHDHHDHEHRSHDHHSHDNHSHDNSCGTAAHVANTSTLSQHPTETLTPVSRLTGHKVHAHGHADTMALVGMGIHNFSDGLTTAAAFAVSRPLGFVVILAIILHQMAAGVSVGAIMLRAGRSHRRTILSTAFIALFILLGAVFYHSVVPVGAGAQGVILGLAGGSFLYVAACDLLPEAHAEDEGWSVTAATICGYAFALFVKLFLAPHSH